MKYVTIFKSEKFWVFMAGYMLGIYIGHDTLIQRLGSDWRTVFETSHQPLIVRAVVLASSVIPLLIAVVSAHVVITMINRILKSVRRSKEEA